MKTIFLILGLFVISLTINSVFGDERICTENRICIFSGDFLTYSGNQISEFSYFFEDSVDPDRIQYLEKGFDSDGNPYEEKYILDLLTGDTYEIGNPDEKFSSFAMMVPLPLKIDESSPDVSSETYQFKKSKRPVWVVESKVTDESGVGSAKIILDKETGIVFEMILNSQTEFAGQTISFDVVNILLDTNIIDKDTKLENKKQVLQEIVPEWIRNTALWWSDGLISDDEFVSGIQFLINEGIIQISAESNSSETTLPFVPNWIKDTAGWWGTKKVSDADFLNGIKWLVENGILRV